MESEFIEWLRSRLAPSSAVDVGIGDDAAVLKQLDERCVITSDMLMDGVDFVLEEVDPCRVGRKALAVNLSDIAAMAARPVAAIVSLALPRDDGLTVAKRIYDGLLPLASEMGVAVAGGDTNSWDQPLAISITLIGVVGPRGPLLRNGGRPGDEILVTGSFGGSILGRHFDFQPRVEEAIVLRERYDLHAGIDVSDGLSLDVARLAAGSNCGAVIDLDAVPVAPQASQLTGRHCGQTWSPLEHALRDGEDFELVLAVPAVETSRMLDEQPLDVPLTRIGRLIQQPGLWQANGGELLPLEPQGYQHQLEQQ